MNLSLIGLQNAGKTFLVNVVAAESEEIRKKGFKGVENGDNAADEEGQRLVQENKEENKEGLKSLEPLLATEEDRKFGVPWLKLGGWGLTVTLGVPKVNPEVSAHYGLFLMGRTLKRSLFRGWKPKSDLPLLVEKYVNKEIQIDDYITHHLPFDDINNAFDLMKERKCLRCVIQMPR
ncbi:Alcohol dehydrogenase-like [Arachis hypogaea]|nr:Alcohol dehydrogenase-like [Arachis hypogaea]